MNENLNEKAKNVLLFQAIEYKRTDLIKPLIRLGADPNMIITYNLLHCDQTYMPLLMYVFDQGNYAIAIELIESGADVNATDNCGDTILMYAACHYDESSIQIRNYLGQSDYDIFSTLINLGAKYDIESIQNFFQNSGFNEIPFQVKKMLNFT